VVNVNCVAGERNSPRDSFHVMIAEDAQVNQMLLRMALERMGHTTVTVGNGRDAVEQFSREHFDLIFMDVQMPEMDGLVATGKIRQMENTRGGHVPIFAMTAHALQGDRDRCLAAGMDGYVSKPAKLDAIANAVKTAASMGRSLVPQGIA
jgi:two-component system, sensor histidine kinase and response regulator